MIINGKKYFTLSGDQDNKWFENKITISDVSGKHKVNNFSSAHLQSLFRICFLILFSPGIYG